MYALCFASSVLRRLAVMMMVTAAVLVGIGSVQARPERIKPGISYYADECEEHGGVFDLVGERNLEEVYRNYSYCEVVYDDRERVKIYRQYRRGEVILTEHYSYDEAGRLLQRRTDR